MKKRTEPTKKKLAKQKPQESKEARENKSGDAGDRLRDYARYSGMAFQMGLIILAGTYIGKKLDEYFHFERPYLTVLLALLSTFSALYLVLKDLFIPTKKEEEK